MVLSRALVAFDERRADPTTNLGTLGAAGNVAYTGTVRLAPTNTAYVRLPGVAGNFLSTPDAASFTPAVSLQVDWDYTPTSLLSVEHVLVSHFGSDGNRGWRLFTGTSTIGLTWTPTGLDSGQVGVTATHAQLGISPGVRSRGRMIWRGDNGTGNWDVRWYRVDGEGVATLVDTDTGSGTSSMFNSSWVVEVGSRTGGLSPLVGNVHDVAVTVDGVLALDVDTAVLTDEGATSFLARTGQTVTINRSTGATYKTEIVVPGTGSRLFNGTSDFGEVPDLAGLNFGASDSSTVFALVRQWATQPTSAVVAKKDSLAAAAGYALYHASGSNGLIVADGTVSGTRTIAPALGALGMLAGIRDVGADTLAAHYNGTTTAPTADPTTATLANSSTLRVGRLSGAGTSYACLRVYAWGVFPGALTSAQLVALRAALTSSDPGVGPRTATLTVPQRTLEISA
jgi:hypothetical protein